MKNEDNSFPDWAETATKGDLIEAVVFLNMAVTGLAGAIISMRAHDEAGAHARLNAYFDASKLFDKIIDNIGGRTVDGE